MRAMPTDQPNPIEIIKRHITRSRQTYAETRSDVVRSINSGFVVDGHAMKELAATEAAHVLWHGLQLYADYVIKNNGTAELAAYRDATTAQIERSRSFLSQTETDSTCAFTRARDTETRNAHRHFLRQAEPAAKLLAA